MKKETTKGFLRNWMSVLRDDIRRTKLKELVIPGSHDSNTHSLSRWHIGYHFAACQSMGIYDQLEKGIRMLDLRYGPGNNKTLVVDQHGPVKGEDFLNSFKDIQRFLEAYPDEFVIVNMQNIEALPANSREYLIENIIYYIGVYLINQSDFDTWFHIETVTMEEIFSKSKRILLFSWSSLWDGSKYSFIDCKSMGIHLQDDCIVSKWHNTDKVSEMFKNNITDLQDWNMRNFHAKKLFAIQVVLTLQGGFKNIMRYVCSFKPPTIYSFASKVIHDNNLLKFLSQALSLGTNLVILDYIDIEPSAIEMIIMYNVSHTIDIKACFIGKQDCTPLFHHGLLDGRMLLVTNIKDIFKDKKERNQEVIIIYSFNGGPLLTSLINKNSKNILIYKHPLENSNCIQSQTSTLVYYNSNRYMLHELPYTTDDSISTKELISTGQGFPFLMIRQHLLTIISESEYKSIMIEQSYDRIL
jgi:hypothetical protein